MNTTSHSSNRLSLRNRTGPIRTKMGDENATSRHARKASGTTGIVGVSHSLSNVVALKNGIQRSALGEVTKTAVNLKETVAKLTGNGKDKDTTEVGTKRSRSSSLAALAGAQRVPLGPSKAPAAQAAPAAAVQPRATIALRTVRATAPLRPTQKIVVHQDPVIVHEDVEEVADEMEIENVKIAEPIVIDSEPEQSSKEVEDMVQLSDDEDEFAEYETQEFAAPRAPRMWPELGTARKQRYEAEIQQIRETFRDEIDPEDTTMVSEYSDEIFEYMQELEEDCMPNADYMDGQSELSWSTRQTLVDWLLQVHLRYHMLPETLWIAVNIVDRFLTKRIVSLLKLQLVGVTAMFIAAKYEEIMAPSVDEFVFMTEKGYTKEEILKGERIVLQSLEFKISQYCSPYSWMRKISKADDYDLQTRTLSKFLTEVTLLDYRFLRVKPSMVAAIGMYTARKMLGGDWNERFVFYSGFTEEHLRPGHAMLIQKLCEMDFSKQYVCRKYANKKFLKASIYAIDWARTYFDDEGRMDGMVLQE
ncbi:cyclin [Phanerochaete sordida]|uniref:Cyclin n=1 Tax=Phanerochaete sordida TaxID=48140 RepID=A0A9P3GJD2_9APHY|nr:cyclin [Phanerochaete sordida]